MITEIKKYEATCDICHKKLGYEHPIKSEESVPTLPPGWGIMFDYSHKYDQGYVDLCPECLKDTNTYVDNEHP